MKTNTVARKSLTKGAAQAIRLNAQRTIAPHVLNATFHLTAENAQRGSVQARHAAVDFQRGALIVRKGEAFFLVESAKFAGRFYVLIERNGQWFSSSDDSRVTAQLVERSQAIREASKTQEVKEVVSSNDPHAGFNALCAKFAEEAAKANETEQKAAVAEAEKIVAQPAQKTATGKYHAGMFNARGASCYVSDEEMAELKARVEARKANETFPKKKVQEHKRASQFAGMDNRGFVIQAVPELGGRMVPMKAA